MDNSITKINKLSLLTEEQNFWNDTSKAQIIMKEKKQLERLVDIITNIENQKTQKLDISELVPGSYYLRVNSNKIVFVKKLIKY